MRPCPILAVLLLAAAIPAVAIPGARAQPIPSGFENTGADRQAIEALLHTYTDAVSTKNQGLFETILLNTNIPFSGTWNVKDGRTANYDLFRKAVFGGGPLTQSFRDVRIEQDGDLAMVRLVFINRAPGINEWGLKTLQLLKVGGRWKIASEFYTGHNLPKGD